MSSDRAIDLTSTFLDAFMSASAVTGYTHAYYRYPARFSPQFARAAILALSKPGDIILDPFMGSGTTLVEAIANGRSAIGTDINPLAYFLAVTKTRVLSERELQHIDTWVKGIDAGKNEGSRSQRHASWALLGYQKDVPWHLRKAIESILDEIDSLGSAKLKRFARCALLRTGQWALDNTKRFPSTASFRERYAYVLQVNAQGMAQLHRDVSGFEVRPAALCFDVEAAQLKPALWQDHFRRKPRLVVTSPPYPSVHVLYHRWQIHGRKETSSPYWIIGKRDGSTESHYMMGSRSASGLDGYFQILEDSFRNIHSLLAADAIVVQLISFSSPGASAFAPHLARGASAALVRYLQGQDTVCKRVTTHSSTNRIEALAAVSRRYQEDGE